MADIKLKDIKIKCPVCKKEMKRFGSPEAHLTPVHDEGILFPKEIKCSVYHIFSCEKCEIKVSKPENKIYRPSDASPDHAVVVIRKEK